MTLREEVEALALPEGRVVGTLGHKVARQHLERRLVEIGLAAYRDGAFKLSYQRGGSQFTNLVGVAPGRRADLAPVLIGAHYDSVIQAPCADDNAAAVAIALAAGKHFLEHPAERDVVIALFDAEEPGFFQTASMGSIRFYEDQRRPEGFHAALIMDLVGHDVPLPNPELGPVIPNFPRLLFLTGPESHPRLPDVVRSARVSGLPVVATLNRRVGDMSDHRVFRLNNVPYLFLTCARWEHYHRPTDTPDRLNYDKMGRIRDYLIRLTETIAGIELPPAGMHDTTEFEVRMLRESLGETGSQLLAAAVGLGGLRTSADLDALAERVQSYFAI